MTPIRSSLPATREVDEPGRLETDPPAASPFGRTLLVKEEPRGGNGGFPPHVAVAVAAPGGLMAPGFLLGVRRKRLGSMSMLAPGILSATLFRHFSLAQDIYQDWYWFSPAQQPEPQAKRRPENNNKRKSQWKTTPRWHSEH